MMIDTDLTVERTERFAASLDELPRDSTSRNGTWTRLGVILMVVGAITAVIATLMSQFSDNPLDQFTQISLGLAGVAVTVLGAAVFLRYSFAQFLRFWLLRLIAEQSSPRQV